MRKESHVSLVVASVLDYCTACRGHEGPRLIASIRRLAAHLSPLELVEIERRVRRQLRLAEPSAIVGAPIISS